MGKTLSRILLALAGAGLIATAQAAGVSDKEIVLGTHMDLSGPAAAGMAWIRNGTQMRIDEANEAGGINGRKIRLIVEDNAGQPQQAVRAMQKLINKDEVFAFINCFGTPTNLAAVKLAVDAKAIYFAPWGASLAFQGAAKSPLVFTTVANYHTTTTTSVSWAIKTWGVKKIGLVYMEGAYGDLLKMGLKPALEAHGLQLTAEAGFKPGDIDLSSQIAKMKQAGVELILVGAVLREAIAAMGEVKKLGWTDVKVMTALPGRNRSVSDLGKDTVEGLYGVGGWRLFYYETATPAVKKWIESYRARFKGEPNENSSNAYSYADWLLKGIQAAGRDLTTEKLVQVLQASSQEDFTTYARQTFKNNHIDPELVEIDQVKGGRWVSIAPPMSGLIK